MPDWKVHLIFGLLLLVLWTSVIQKFSFIILNFQKFTILILLILFVSIFPDIDVKQSKSRKMFALTVSITAFILYTLLFPNTWYYGLAYFFILYLLITLFPTKHRGVTHSFIFSLLFSLAITYLLSLVFGFGAREFLSWFFLVFSTYALHLVLDKF
jgi:membrane-bound metal-dependent hydrolase YbcI (DUF457 family)